MKSTYFKQNPKRISIANVFIVMSLSLSLGLGLYLVSVLTSTQNRNALGNVLGATTQEQPATRKYSDESIKFEYSSNSAIENKIPQKCTLNDQEKTFSTINFKDKKFQIQINPCSVVFDIESIEKEMKITSIDNKVFQYTLIKTAEGYIGLASHQEESEIYIISKTTIFDEAIKLEREMIGIIMSMEII
jgi:hypothetical protein